MTQPNMDELRAEKVRSDHEDGERAEARRVEAESELVVELSAIARKCQMHDIPFLAIFVQHGDVGVCRVSVFPDGTPSGMYYASRVAGQRDNPILLAINQELEEVERQQSDE